MSKPRLFVSPHTMRWNYDAGSHPMDNKAAWLWCCSRNRAEHRT